MCGACKPPLYFSVLCPVCGTPATVTREEFLMYFDLPHRLTDEERRMRVERAGERPTCAQCTSDITDAVRAAVMPEPCVKHGIVCGYPCGQRTVKPRQGAKPCPTMVPVRALDR